MGDFIPQAGDRDHIGVILSDGCVDHIVGNVSPSVGFETTNCVTVPHRGQVCS